MIYKLMSKNTVLFLLMVVFSCGSGKKLKVENRKPKEVETKTTTQNQIEITEIKTGADNYMVYLPLLKDKKVGIVTNQTGIIKIHGEMGSVKNKKGKNSWRV